MSSTHVKSSFFLLGCKSVRCGHQQTQVRAVKEGITGFAQKTIKKES